MVERGEFNYAGLPKIYVIAFPGKRVLPTPGYHPVATLRSETGEIINARMTAPADRFIVVALAKAEKQKIQTVDVEAIKNLLRLGVLTTAQIVNSSAYIIDNVAQ